MTTLNTQVPNQNNNIRWSNELTIERTIFGGFEEVVSYSGKDEKEEEE